MADDSSASIIPLHQVPPKLSAKAAAAGTRVRAPRKSRKAKAAVATDEDAPARTRIRTPAPSSESLIPEEYLSTYLDQAEPPAPPPRPVAPPPAETALVPVPEPERAPARVSVIPSRRHLAPVLLSTAALALACVGIITNGWFARSLGSSDIAGWLFMAIGVAADLVALVMPSCAAGLWQIGQRITALVGWGVWAMTFVFAVTAGIGFASVNIADTTLSRASRATPAVQTAQAALNDAMTARDRECKGGVGKFCREREAAVNDRRQALDTAMRAVETTADPQTEAAVRIVAWVSRGALQPSSNDFAMLRLVLLALLPQIGGILLMVGRSRG